jgi:hypothetical protein
MGFHQNNNFNPWILGLFLIINIHTFIVRNTLSQSVTSVQKIADLPEDLVETSGLLMYDDLVWSFNDSEGDPELMGYSIKEKKIVKRVTIWNGYNFDWEDITQDSANIYIGDIGNNFGNRDNLCIYSISKRKLTKSCIQAVKADKIFYTYPGYKSVSIFKLIRSSYDCEAMVYSNGLIYLFTKDWNTLQSTIYSIPAKPGKYTALKIGTFNADGLITAADYDGKQLVLLGYKNYHAFMWIFKSINNFRLNEQNGKRIELNEFGGAQTEGIAIADSVTYIISNEKSSVPQQIREVKIK